MTFYLKTLFMLIFLGLFLLANGSVMALPDLSKTIIINDTKIIGDRENHKLFYLVPKGIKISERPDGGPHISFSLLQYVGSNPREDLGEFKIYSSFRIRIELEKHSQQEREILEAKLIQQHDRAITLIDISLDQISAYLVNSVGGETPLTQTAQYDERISTSSSSYVSAWHERDLVMSFTTDEAELLERVLKQNDAGLSLAFSIGSKVWRLAEIEVEGNFSRPDITEQYLLGEIQEDQASIEPVVADAIPIRIADEFLESRIKRYFLDGALPASYPTLAVYYFDMKNGNSGDVYIRSVEVEAVGVSGGKTRFSTMFEVDRPLDYASTVRFPYAVNLLEPYRWRSTDILQTGEIQVGPWYEGDNWSTVINASGSLQLDQIQPTHGGEQ